MGALTERYTNAKIRLTPCFELDASGWVLKERFSDFPCAYHADGQFARADYGD